MVWYGMVWRCMAMVTIYNSAIGTITILFTNILKNMSTHTYTYILFHRNQPKTILEERSRYPYINIHVHIHTHNMLQCICLFVVFDVRHVILVLESYILIYSCTHILIHSYTRILMYSYTHILKYLYTYILQILIYSYTQILMYSYTQILMYSYTHTLILKYSCTHVPVHSSSLGAYSSYIGQHASQVYYEKNARATTSRSSENCKV